MSCRPGMTGETDPSFGPAGGRSNLRGRMNDILLDFLWETDPEGARFIPQLLSFSFRPLTTARV